MLLKVMQFPMILRFFWSWATNQETEYEIRKKLKNYWLNKINEIKFPFEVRLKLVLEFQKIENDDKTKHDTFYWHSNAETNINKIDIENSFKSIDIQLHQTYKTFY